MFTESSLSGTPITRGEFYDIAIFACGVKAIELSDDDCYMWAEVTLNNELWNSLTSQIPNLRFVPASSGDRLTPQFRGPHYYIHWQAFPGASYYFLFIRECADTSSQCIPINRIGRRNHVRLDSHSMSGRIAVDLFDYGTRYLIELRACLPGQDGNDCTLWDEVTFTTQDRAS